MDSICGIHAAKEAIESGRPIQHVHFQQGLKNPRLRELQDECRRRGIPMRMEPVESLERLAQGSHHQGVVAVAAGHHYSDLEDVLAKAPENSLILILDGVQDPHNLGALIRTACVVGAQAVVIPDRRSAGLTSTVLQAASGAAEHIPVVRVVNLDRTIEELKERSYWIYGVDEQGDKTCDEADFMGNCAIVMGGEGKGLHQLLKKRCDFLVKIPTWGKISTLNVSVAAGIVLFEAARQRHKPKGKKS
jgi:23S rRNA (guanosine2251-2'-O)-methyltransferase